jgi:hypothetical protein
MDNEEIKINKKEKGEESLGVVFGGETVEAADGLEKDVIERISIGKIKPVAKWKFVFKNWMLWVLGGFSILLGALAFSSVLYFFQPNEIEIFNRSGADWKEFLLFSLPYFWIIFLMLFLFCSWYYFKHTEKGYRYSVILVFVTSIFFSIFFGAMLYSVGFAKLLDNFLGRQSFYGDIINPRAKFWLNPERGRLGGLVVEKKSDKEFVIYSKDIGEWKIESSSVIGSKVKKGMSVIVVGRKTSQNSFIADDVFPPSMGQEFLKRGGDPRIRPDSDISNHPPF